MGNTTAGWTRRGACALLALAPLTALVSLSGCGSQDSAPTEEEDSAADAASTLAAFEEDASPTGTLSLDTVNDSGSKTRRTERVRARAKGASVFGASRVTFEVLNTSDAKASAISIEGTRARSKKSGAGKHATWTCRIDPAQVGPGVWAVKAAAIDAAGTRTFVAETSYTYCVTFECRENIVVGGGGYDVKHGMAGLKVLRVQQVVGVGLDRYPRYLDATETAVRQWQESHGVTATGVVDRATWTAMGLDAVEWYALGAYASPAQAGPNATASERVEALCARAQDYVGDLYEWDASGQPGQGIDCAGLVIQALYAAGCDPGIVNPVTHSTTTWGDQDALNLYQYCNLRQVDFASRARGDLVFYDLAGKGTVGHVGIYLGNDQLVEAHPKGVRVSDVNYATPLGVRRIFG